MDVANYLGTFYDEQDLQVRVEAILRHSESRGVRLVGPTGSGKTHFIHELVRAWDATLEEVTLTAEVTKYDLVATYILKDGSTQVRLGPIGTWLKQPPGKPHFLYIGEVNFGLPQVLQLLQQLSDFRGSIYVPELGETLRRTSEHYMVLDYNPAEKSGYAGANQMNISLLSRFEGVVVRYMSEDSETKVLLDRVPKLDYAVARRLVGFARKTRQAYERGQLSSLLSTRNIANYGNLLVDGGLDLDEVVSISAAQFLDDERADVMRLWSSQLGGQAAGVP